MRLGRHHGPLIMAAMLAASSPSLWPSPAPAASQKIIGSATYRERIALTPDAVFEATLEDVSLADALAKVIARVRLEDPGQVPIDFEIAYDPQRIDPRGTYVVRASIRDSGGLRFTSTQGYPVLTQGHGGKVAVSMRATSKDGETRERVSRPVPVLGPLPVTFAGLLPCADCLGLRYQINLLPRGAYMQRMSYLRNAHDASYYEVGAWSVSKDGRTLTLESGRDETTYWLVKDSRTLRKLDRKGNPIDSDLPYELTRRAGIEPMEPRVELSGMFRYMADAARFRDCRSGLQWPVAMSEDYRALEHAYTARPGAHGSELLVSLKGRIEQRPRMEGEGTEPTLVVEKFLRAMPGENCQERTAGVEIGNTRWRPTRIGDRDVVVSGQQREPWIELDPRSMRATGSGGCNRFSGGYEAGSGTLRFDRLASTMMACPSIETESAFLRALQAARRYRLQGRTLELSDDRGRFLVRLEERNLR
jgi:uncharacterized lipoprotein YbaY/heat shock protein HslJ/uncharacterized lipoprotein NlpE involved in copper resistance